MYPTILGCFFFFFKIWVMLGVMPHTYNPSTKEAETQEHDCKLKASLVNTASSRLARAI